MYKNLSVGVLQIKYFMHRKFMLQTNNHTNVRQGRSQEFLKEVSTGSRSQMQGSGGAAP